MGGEVLLLEGLAAATIQRAGWWGRRGEIRGCRGGGGTSRYVTYDMIHSLHFTRYTAQPVVYATGWAALGPFAKSSR